MERAIRVKVLRKVGIRGNFHELRPAHAQRLKKLGVPIEAVNKAARTLEHEDL